jgi:hypothetical protein
MEILINQSNAKLYGKRKSQFGFGQAVGNLEQK